MQKQPRLSARQDMSSRIVFDSSSRFELFHNNDASLATAIEGNKLIDQIAGAPCYNLTQEIGFRRIKMLDCDSLYFGVSTGRRQFYAPVFFFNSRKYLNTTRVISCYNSILRSDSSANILPIAAQFAQCEEIRTACLISLKITRNVCRICEQKNFELHTNLENLKTNCFLVSKL